MRRTRGAYSSRFYTEDWYDDRYQRRRPSKPYGCLGFLGDVFMTILTSGFWLIWIYVREKRR